MDINTILQGDCVELMNTLPEKSVDLIFADPPYNLQLPGNLYRPNDTKVDAVDDAWDQFASPAEYDAFTCNWLSACRKVLKDTGTLWVIGTYHNIYRVGKLMADLGFWLLNDIVWIKANPMPNFRGARFTNAHESLLWAKKSKNQKSYTFNYHAMKELNDGKQMRSDWLLPICSGNERCRINGEKAHSTQKPEALLYRVILSSSNVGDTVLDPFFGSGTTGAVAKRLRRNWLGIEKNSTYIQMANDRIANITPLTEDSNLLITPSRRNLPRVTFGNLLESGLLQVGQTLYSKDMRHKAVICADAALQIGKYRGSIHQTGAYLEDKRSCNGWDFWHFMIGDQLHAIDELRNQYRSNNEL